jgi:hypothetical protein
LSHAAGGNLGMCSIAECGSRALGRILHSPQSSAMALRQLPSVRALPISGERTPQPGESMSKPLIVSIPHQLGREEAARRIKSGFSAARTNYSTFVTFHEEAWTGDRLAFNVSALGQTASGILDVADDHVRLEVTLPWLLAKVAKKLTPAIRKEATLMLEHKNK